MAAGSRWNNESLRGTFLSGLNDSIKDKLAVGDDPES